MTQEIGKHIAPKRLPFELVKEVAGQTDPVVIKRKTINKTDEIVKFSRMKPLPRAYFINKVIREESTVPRYLLGIIPWGTTTRVSYRARANVYYAECLGSLDETIPKYSQELENLKLADAMKQHIEGVAAIKAFILDENVIKLLLVVFGISIPFGLLMNTILGLIPHQIVIWQP